MNEPKLSNLTKYIVSSIWANVPIMPKPENFRAFWEEDPKLPCGLDSGWGWLLAISPGSISSCLSRAVCQNTSPLPLESSLWNLGLDGHRVPLCNLFTDHFLKVRVCLKSLPPGKRVFSHKKKGLERIVLYCIFKNTNITWYIRTNIKYNIHIYIFNISHWKISHTIHLIYHTKQIIYHKHIHINSKKEPLFFHLCILWNSISFYNVSFGEVETEKEPCYYI